MVPQHLAPKFAGPRSYGCRLWCPGLRNANTLGIGDLDKFSASAMAAISPRSIYLPENRGKDRLYPAAMLSYKTLFGHRRGVAEMHVLPW